MQLRRLGHSGLALSELTLGTLTWARDTDEHDATSLLEAFLDAGGTTIDVPSDFHTPSFDGRVSLVGHLTRAHRSLSVIGHSNLDSLEPPALPHTVPPIASPPSRGALLSSLDHLLRGLGRETIDLWLVHGPRRGITHAELAWTLRAAVDTGRATYVGLAHMDPWDVGQIAAMLDSSSAPLRGLSGRFSLLGASDASFFPHCAEAGIGYVALAPLAAGVLTGKYRHSTPPDSRAASTHLRHLVDPYFGTDQARVVEAVVRVSEGLGVPPAAVALAWVLTQPTVASAVIGPRGPRQFESLLEGTTMRLARELREALTEVAIS